MQLDKEDRQQKLEETFQGVKYPKAEVERGFRFWDVVRALFCSVCAPGAGANRFADRRSLSPFFLF